MMAPASPRGSLRGVDEWVQRRHGNVRRQLDALQLGSNHPAGQPGAAPRGIDHADGSTGIRDEDARSVFRSVAPTRGLVTLGETEAASVRRAFAHVKYQPATMRTTTTEECEWLRGLQRSARRSSRRPPRRRAAPGSWCSTKYCRNEGRSASPRLTLRRNARCEMRIICPGAGDADACQVHDDVECALRNEGVEHGAQQAERRGDDDAP